MQRFGTQERTLYIDALKLQRLQDRQHNRSQRHLAPTASTSALLALTPTSGIDNEQHTPRFVVRHAVLVVVDLTLRGLGPLGFLLRGRGRGKPRVDVGDQIGAGARPLQNDTFS